MRVHLLAVEVDRSRRGLLVLALIATNLVKHRHVVVLVLHA